MTHGAVNLNTLRMCFYECSGVVSVIIIKYYYDGDIPAELDSDSWLAGSSPSRLGLSDWSDTQEVNKSSRGHTLSATDTMLTVIRLLFSSLLFLVALFVCVLLVLLSSSLSSPLFLSVLSVLFCILV